MMSKRFSRFGQSTAVRSASMSNFSSSRQEREISRSFSTATRTMACLRSSVASRIASPNRAFRRWTSSLSSGVGAAGGAFAAGAAGFGGAAALAAAGGFGGAAAVAGAAGGVGFAGGAAAAGSAGFEGAVAASGFPSGGLGTGVFSEGSFTISSMGCLRARGLSDRRNACVQPAFLTHPQKQRQRRKGEKLSVQRCEN